MLFLRQARDSRQPTARNKLQIKAELLDLVNFTHGQRCFSLPLRSGLARGTFVRVARYDSVVGHSGLNT